MKRLLYILSGLAICMPAILKAQLTATDVPVIRTEPAIYTMDESVKWIFDFGNSSNIEAGAPLHMWIWSPNTAVRPDSNPDSPAKAQNEPVPLVDEGNKVWSLTLTPTIFFGKTADEILNNNETYFWFNIRGAADVAVGGETGTLQIPKRDHIANFVAGGKRMEFGPTDFQLGSTLTILFNANTVEGFLPAPSTLHMHGSMNSWTYTQGFDAWLPDIREKTVFKDLGGGIYKKDLVPLAYFPGVDEETIMENITFVIAKYNGNDATPDWAGAAGAEGGDFVILAPGLPIPPPAKFYLFPMKVSKNDILVITRDNNDRGQSLSYSVSGGGKTVSGKMEGAMTQQRAFVNIPAEFGATGATSLNILVTDNNDRTIYEGMIPLVTVDNITK